jgi:hypothetical protein
VTTGPSLMGMDIREIFKEISEQLLSEFRKTGQIKHSGGRGGLREVSFAKFLEDHLPKLYAIGRGEIITPENRISGELDVVIYDSFRCPALMRSDSHSVFPIESVYGAISVKSHLTSAKLKEAYQNIGSLKEILLKRPIVYKDNFGFQATIQAPFPVTGVIAYDAKRSIEAIHKQIRALDDELADIELRPDFVAVVGKGIIDPLHPLRGQGNVYAFPKAKSDLATLRKTGRYTLLRLYIEIVRELNNLILGPLDLRAYDNMPRLVGKYRVWQRSDRFIATAGRLESVLLINEAGVEEIVRNSKPIKLSDLYLHQFGTVPEDAKGEDLDYTIYEYNPQNLPPFSLDDIKYENGKVFSNSFQPLFYEIDGKDYAADIRGGQIFRSRSKFYG